MKDDYVDAAAVRRAMGESLDKENANEGLKQVIDVLRENLNRVTSIRFFC